MVINDDVYINSRVILLQCEAVARWHGITLIETMGTKSGVLNGQEK